MTADALNAKGLGKDFRAKLIEVPKDRDEDCFARVTDSSVHKAIEALHQAYMVSPPEDEEAYPTALKSLFKTWAHYENGTMTVEGAISPVPIWIGSVQPDANDADVPSTPSASAAASTPPLVPERSPHTRLTSVLQAQLSSRAADTCEQGVHMYTSFADGPMEQRKLIQSCQRCGKHNQVRLEVG